MSIINPVISDMIDEIPDLYGDRVEQITARSHLEKLEPLVSDLSGGGQLGLVRQIMSFLSELGDNENIPELQRVGILKVIAEIPRDERCERVRRASDRFRDEVTRGKLRLPLDDVDRWDLVERRLQLLRTPLGKFFSPLPNDPEPEGG